MKNSDIEKAFEGKHVDANFVKNLLEDNGRQAPGTRLQNCHSVGSLPGCSVYKCGPKRKDAYSMTFFLLF